MKTSSVTYRRNRKRGGQWLPSILRFLLTIFTSAFVSIWAIKNQDVITLGVNTINKIVSPYFDTSDENEGAETETRHVNLAPNNDPALDQLRVQYARHLEDSIVFLKLKKRYLVSSEIFPASILKYQRKVDSLGEESDAKLIPLREQIPVYVISRKAKSYLDQALVIYLELKKIPKKFLPDSLKEKDPSQFLLVPDLIGKNINAYHFN